MKFLYRFILVALFAAPSIAHSSLLRQSQVNMLLVSGLSLGFSWGNTMRLYNLWLYQCDTQEYIEFYYKNEECRITNLLSHHFDEVKLQAVRGLKGLKIIRDGAKDKNKESIKFARANFITSFGVSIFLTGFMIYAFLRGTVKFKFD